jgi:hypothetical protein
MKRKNSRLGIVNPELKKEFQEVASILLIPKN